MTNRLASAISKMNLVPAPLRPAALSTVMGNIVPFVGTASLIVDELSETRAVIGIRNRRKVQNHIGSVHAAAMTLLAETASGFVVGMNVPDDKVPVVKTIGMEFKKRAKGDLRAVATLTDEDRSRMRNDPKGEVSVPVTLTDEEGKEPIVVTMVWAWTPKRA